MTRHVSEVRWTCDTEECGADAYMPGNLSDEEAPEGWTSLMADGRRRDYCPEHEHVLPF